MLQLSNLRLTEQYDIPGLRHVAAEILSIPETAVRGLQIQKLSIDARRKPDIRFVYTILVSVDDDWDILSKHLLKPNKKNECQKSLAPNVSSYEPPEQYQFPAACPVPSIKASGASHPDRASSVNDGTGPAVVDGARPVVVDGAGPVVVDGAGPVVVDGAGPVVVDGAGPVVVDGTGPAVVDGAGPVVVDGAGSTVVDGAGPAVVVGTKPVVIVGSGPAGLFSALCLAEAGIRCVILERGQPVERRIEDVERFRRGGELDPSSNIQFGEGGAGTFSDGKLTTGINDKRIRYVLERLVGFGAPEDILYLAKPHIGTDKLRYIVKAIRNRLIGLGCDIRFGHTLSDINISNGALQSIAIRNGNSVYEMAVDTLILAIGNSARDTFEMLVRRGVKLSPKSFSVGVRIEHLQRDIDIAQYGDKAAFPSNLSAGFPSRLSDELPSGFSAGFPTKLPAADYKLVMHLPPDAKPLHSAAAAPRSAVADATNYATQLSGRSVYSFCVCPGGQVVSSSSEPGGVVTNGMSYYSRDGINCNGALLVSVTPDDFGHGPLDGIEFQRKLEQAAFVAGGRNYNAPAQFVCDFQKKRASSGHVESTYIRSAIPGGHVEGTYTQSAIPGRHIKSTCNRSVIPGGHVESTCNQSAIPGRHIESTCNQSVIPGVHTQITPTYLPGVKFCNLWDVLPTYVCQALCMALSDFSKRIAGFADPYAVLTGVETRSSSPVRIERENYETVGIRGIFPCGEGSGFAGGIMSSAVDGIKCAERLLTCQRLATRY